MSTWRSQLWNYCYLNAGLVMNFNGKKYVSKNGLLDLLQRKTNEDELRYPIIHLKGEDIEVASPTKTITAKSTIHL